jgi:hypothetical protein
MKSKRYYNVYHSSEAFDDILYTFKSGKIHTKKITIYKIEEWERFIKKWVDRTDRVIQYVHSTIIDSEGNITIDGNKIILKRNGGEK